MFDIINRISVNDGGVATRHQSCAWHRQAVSAREEATAAWQRQLTAMATGRRRACGRQDIAKHGDDGASASAKIAKTFRALRQRHHHENNINENGSRCSRRSLFVIVSHLLAFCDARTLRRVAAWCIFLAVACLTQPVCGVASLCWLRRSVDRVAPRANALCRARAILCFLAPSCLAAAAAAAHGASLPLLPRINVRRRAGDKRT